MPVPVFTVLRLGPVEVITVDVPVIARFRRSQRRFRRRGERDDGDDARFEDGVMVVGGEGFGIQGIVTFAAAHDGKGGNLILRRRIR